MHPDRRTVNLIAAALIVVSDMCDRVHQARSHIVLDFSLRQLVREAFAFASLTANGCTP
jgi:hypothetical protein